MGQEIFNLTRKAGPLNFDTGEVEYQIQYDTDTGEGKYHIYDLVDGEPVHVGAARQRHEAVKAAVADSRLHYETGLRLLPLPDLEGPNYSE